MSTAAIGSVLVSSVTYDTNSRLTATESPDTSLGLCEPAIQSPGSFGTAGTQISLPYFSTLLQQLDAVGWDKAELSPDLQQVTIQLHDAAHRCHKAEVDLPVGWPIAAPTVNLPLPGPFRVRWLPGDTLSTLTSQLEKVNKNLATVSELTCIAHQAVEWPAADDISL
jgi:hypothetical protein